MTVEANRTAKGGRPAIGEPINIRLPADMLARIDAAAQTEGITRSEWMRQALAERLAILTEA